MLEEKGLFSKFKENKNKFLILGISLSILFLFLLQPNPKEVSISEVDHSLIKRYVRVRGVVKDLYKEKGFTIFNLTKGNESIRVVAFKKLDIKSGEELEVVGRVKIYKKEIEIVLKSLEKG